MPETLEDSDWIDYDEFTPDLTKDMIKNAIESGKIRIYSSKPIEQGIFVSPSKMEAEGYSANGKVYQKDVEIKDVAWISPLEGQYAKVQFANPVASAEGDATQFAVNGNVYDYTKSFAEQIEDFKKNKIPLKDALLVGKTPEVWQKVGFNALPVTINQKHVDYIVNGTGKANHYLGESVLKQFPEKIKKPIAIIRSSSHPDRAVALIDAVHNNEQVVIPVEIDGKGRLNNVRIDSNAIVSSYGKKNAINQLYDAIERKAKGLGNDLFYWDKNEAISLLRRAGLQLPGGSPQDGLVYSIREKGAGVNLKFENVTETQQFKRFFGDWQNNPKKASKVVNDDGTPKVVYHGTNKDFTVFNSSNGTFWFSESYDYAESMAEERGK